MGKSHKEFIPRDISWLSFNERVLQEATDKDVPLLERLKFLGIFSNNQDEFFRVRVAAIRRMAQLSKKTRATFEEDPNDVLKRIQKIVLQQQEKFEQIYQEILRELESHNIHMISEKELDLEQGAFVRNYFQEKIRPSLVPIMLDNGRKFPYLKDKMIYLILTLIRGDKKNRYALIEIPTDVAPRFLVLPSSDGETRIIILDDIIRYCLDDIFSIFEYDKAEAYTIKLTRDAQLDFDNDINASIVEKISKSLKKRKKGEPVRLVYDQAISEDLLAFLLKKLKLSKHDNVIPGFRYHNFKDFMNFPDVGTPDLSYEKFPPLRHKILLNQKSLFAAIRKEDILLAYPYQTFDHIIDLLRESAIDPKVLEIKITLYRVARSSNVLNALVNAARNGKKVTVVVELQARFDEENNIYWANNLQEEGVNVIFGVPGLKVHSKLFIITRKEGGRIVNYAHVGTGNFHEGTALVYSDFSLLTADKRVTSEIEKIFDFFSDNYIPGTYRHLIFSPFFMRKKLIQLINNEIKHAKQGKKAEIILKLNNLTDQELIRKLYDASDAGVQVKMIVRGVCSMITGTKDSENLEAISIVDRFLEHSRIYYFLNNGDELLYLSSADWMERNMDYRVEVACPIYNEKIRSIIMDVLKMQFKGNVKVRLLDEHQSNPYRKRSDDEKPYRAQYEIYHFFRDNLIN